MKEQLEGVFEELLELGLHFDLEVFAYEGEPAAYSAIVEVPSIDSIRQVADIAEARGLRVQTIEKNRFKIDTPESSML